MSLSAVRCALLTLLLLPLPAAAQMPGQVELGGFLQWSVFDGTLAMDDFFATGGRAGVFLSPAFALEADVARTSTNGPPGVAVTYWPLHARLVYNRMVHGRVGAMLGLGVAHNEYGGARDGKDNGLSALFGVRIPVSSTVVLRLDVNADYMPSPANQSSTVRHNWNYGVREGLSIMLGRRRTPQPEQQVVRPEPPRAEPRQPEPPAAIPPVGDADQDGVADQLDRCPGTPAGTLVDTSGCPLDSDMDGVPNTLDRCPDTPAGTVVSASGCALDSDGDGVPDAIDRCPNTSPGTRVDAAGCLLLFEENRKSLILEGVNFADARAELTPESAWILDNVAASLVANEKVRVVVEGHTSITGTRIFNMGLSWARAAAVRDYLITRGVSPDRMVARGFGPDRPIASNATAEGQARNRRVELRQTPEEGGR